MKESFRSAVYEPFRLSEVTDGVDRRAKGGGLRARLGGSGDAGGKAGNLVRAEGDGDAMSLLFFRAAAPKTKAGETGAGETDVDVVGVVTVNSVADMLREVERGDVGPESMSAGGAGLTGVELTRGDGGNGMRWGEEGREILDVEA